MKIAIVDDEISWRESVKTEILQCNAMNKIEIDTFDTGEKYLKSKKQYDISFIDIEMPKIDGFETISRARAKNNNGIYIILTTHTEMSRKGYFVNAFRYLDKTHLEEIREAIDSALVVLERNKKIEVNAIGDEKREIVLKDIIYIETEKHYILVHTKYGTIKCSDSMKVIEERLPDKWFFRCHNVFIVNLDEISRIDGRIVYLSNGDDVDIAHRKLNQFKKLYINRQYECANA